MKTKTKAFKIKNKDLEKEIATKRAFMWKVVDKKEINSKKTKVFFQRGREDFTTKKGYKKVKKLEKMHNQLAKKRAPVGAIILTIIEIGLIVPIFILNVELAKIILISVASVFGAIVIFIWLAYLIMMIRKKKLLKYCQIQASKFDAHPETNIDSSSPSVEVITPIEIKKEITENDVVEPYMQGDDK